MGKLLILFIVGLVLALSTFAYIYYNPINPNSIWVIIPGAIGVFLLLFSGSIGIRRFVRGLEEG
jgi:hypothetical protein